MRFLSNRLRDLREDRDLTQGDIADFLHVSRQAYERYENGKRNIPNPTLIELSKFFDTSIDFLLRSNQ